MNLSFEKNEADRYRHEIISLRAAYKNAIDENKKFSEVKKIYDALKRSKEKFRSAVKNDAELQMRQ